MDSTLITAKHLALRENHPNTRARIEHIQIRFKREHPSLFSGKKSGSEIRSVKARVDFGRWLADCECGGAEYVDPEVPVFFCNSCGNVEFNGDVRPVEFPNEATRQMIEKTLLTRQVDDSRGADAIERAMTARPLIRGLSRSWDPWESVSDLKKQNREAGLK